MSQMAILAHTSILTKIHQTILPCSRVNTSLLNTKLWACAHIVLDPIIFNFLINKCYYSKEILNIFSKAYKHYHSLYLSK